MIAPIMKLRILSFFAFLILARSNSQNIIAVALEDKPHIIAETPFKLRLDNYTFHSREFFGWAR